MANSRKLQRNNAMEWILEAHLKNWNY